MKCYDIIPQFVEYIPDELVEGILYVSIPFTVAVHKCCCGCGSKVVTPLDPDDWEITFDGKTISLDPSIGNWSFPCQSHYWIRRNKVEWVRKWSQEEIRISRGRVDKSKKGPFRKLKDFLVPRKSED